MGVTLRLAWRNIWRQPRRTGLTLAAIVFSDALMVFMICLQLGQYDLMIEYGLRMVTGHAQIQASGYNKRPQMHVTVDDALALSQKVRDSMDLVGVSPRAMGFAMVSSPKRSIGAQVIGVDPAHEGKVSTLPGLIKQGRYLKDIREPSAVVGSVLARNLQLKLGDELTLLGSGKDGSFAANIVKVVGIFESGNVEFDRYLLQIPLGTFQDTFSMGNSAHTIVVAGHHVDDTPRLVKQLHALVAFNTKLDVLDWNELQPGLQQAIRADFVSAWFMYAIFVAIVAFSVLNTFLMSVLERTREFGIMLALGLRPRRIGRLIMLESLLMSAFGMLLGILTGSLITLYFTINGFTYPGMEEVAKQYNLPGVFHPELSFLGLTMGPGVVFICTLLIALYPASRIRLLRPVDAMRTV